MGKNLRNINSIDHWFSNDEQTKYLYSNRKIFAHILFENPDIIQDNEQMQKLLSILNTISHANIQPENKTDMQCKKDYNLYIKFIQQSHIFII